MLTASCTDERFVDPKRPLVRSAASTATANISVGKEAMVKRPVGVHLYSGVGGMGLGFEQAGFDIGAAVDIDKINIATHTKNFPSCKTWCADLSKVSGAEIRKQTEIGSRRIDVLFAGPPCQGFSLIGKRAPNDPRNLLLPDLARLIRDLQPSYFVVENVEGVLLRSAKKMLDKFIDGAKSAGYSIVEPLQVLDAADFGVPQRRRRVFVLGYREGLMAPEYPRPSSANDSARRPTVWDAIGDLPNISKFDYLFDEDDYLGRLGNPSSYARFLRGESRDRSDFANKRKRNGDGLGGCLRTVHNSETIRRFRQTKQGTCEEISRFYRLAKNGIAPTLRAGTGPEQGSYMAPRPIHPFQDRCITVREAARLHSFPDWFHFHPTKWHGFRQIGNSVPPRLARAVAGSILKALLKSSREG